MTLKVWTQGDAVDHGDLNGNFAAMLQTAGGAMTGTLNSNMTTLAPAVNTRQTASGTATYAAFGQWPYAGFAYNYKYITNDAVLLGADNISAGRGIVLGEAVQMDTGGGTTGNGARIAHGAFLRVNSPMMAGNNNFFGATWEFAQASVPVTGSSGGSPCGNLYAINPQVQLAPGATNYVSVMAAEVDVEIDTGASAQYKFGITITTAGADAVRGSILDAAMHIGAIPSTAGWTQGIWFTDFNGGGVPISVNGTIMGGGRVGGGTAIPVTHGVDLRNFSFTGRAFTSPGFFVDGTGNIQGGNLTILNVGVSATLSTQYLNVAYHPPSTSTSTGNAGDIAWDASYVYVCIATNTWKRSPISTW